MRNYLWFKPTRGEGREANPAEIPQNPKEQQSLQTAAPTSPSERFPSYFCSQHPGDGRKREEKPQPETEFLDPTLWSECPTARSILVLPEPHSRRSCLPLELHSALGAPTRTRLVLRWGKERPEFQQGSAQRAGRDEDSPTAGNAAAKIQLELLVAWSSSLNRTGDAKQEREHGAEDGMSCGEGGEGRAAGRGGGGGSSRDEPQPSSRAPRAAPSPKIIPQQLLLQPEQR